MKTYKMKQVIKMNTYRIKQVGKDVFYPQVAKKTWLSKYVNILSWKRIGKHVDDFGLYSDDGHHLKTEAEALKVIQDYKDWIWKQGSEVIYIDVDSESDKCNE